MSAPRRSSPRQDLAPVPGSDTDPGPETFRRAIFGRDHFFRYWTSEQWGRTPERERPAGTLKGDRGGRLQAAPVVPYESTEETMRGI